MSKNKDVVMSVKNLSKVFKTKILNADKMKQAYEKGYGASKNKNISKILLEMGIITHIEWDKSTLIK